MKKFVTIILLVVLALHACDKKYHDPLPFSLERLLADSTELKDTLPTIKVEPGATLTATFTADVDRASAVNPNVVLLRDDDQSEVGSKITVSGRNVTIEPVAALKSGALYILSFQAGLRSSDGLALAPTTRSFTVTGTFTPDEQIAFWNFENSASDVLGSYPGTSTSISYVTGRNALAGKAASFNGTTSIIEVPGGDQMVNAEFSIAFWMNLDSSAVTSTGARRGHFIMGVAAANGVAFEVEDQERWIKWEQTYQRSYEHNAQIVVDTARTEVLYNGAGIVHGGGPDFSTVFSRTITPGQVQALVGHQWNHVVYTFSATTKVTSVYWNGALAFRKDYTFLEHVTDQDLAPFFGVTRMAVKDSPVLPGQPGYWEKKWVFGFTESKSSTFPAGEPTKHYTDPDADHFKGELDDVHLYHRALSETEVTLMYNSEK